jgi:hypothetical protein
MKHQRRRYLQDRDDEGVLQGLRGNLQAYRGTSLTTGPLTGGGAATGASIF